MRRLWMIAALTAALAVPGAWAQRRGGSFGGGAHFSGGARMGGGARVGSSFSRGPAMANRGPVFTTSPYNHGGHSGNSFGHNFHHHHGGHRYPFRSYGYGNGYGNGYGYGYPYYPYDGLYGYDPLLWDSSSSDYDSSDADYQQNQQLSQQVNDLSNEIEQMREEQEIRAYTPLPTTRPAAPQTPAKSDPAPPTVLIFRDQHREEINNYAVVGHTLWIFNQDRARKIPLAQLDLPATSKVNDDRGVDFNVPR